jgi:hypothetical protein
MTDIDPAPPEQPPVEKPKRNWRGFLKEYVVIVIGVLTALAAQQAAESWHWQGEVKEARAALHEKSSPTIAAFMPAVSQSRPAWTGNSRRLKQS